MGGEGDGGKPSTDSQRQPWRRAQGCELEGMQWTKTERGEKGSEGRLALARITRYIKYREPRMRTVGLAT